MSFLRVFFKNSLHENKLQEMYAEMRNELCYFVILSLVAHPLSGFFQPLLELEPLFFSFVSVLVNFKDDCVLERLKIIRTPTRILTLSERRRVRNHCRP
jgi:hypothetical protein